MTVLHPELHLVLWVAVTDPLLFTTFQCDAMFSRPLPCFAGSCALSAISLLEDIAVDTTGDSAFISLSMMLAALDALSADVWDACHLILLLSPDAVTNGQRCSQQTHFQPSRRLVSMTCQLSRKLDSASETPCLLLAAADSLVKSSRYVNVPGLSIMS